MTDKALKTLGLAYKAGRVVYGIESVRREIGRCAGILLAADAGSAVEREARFLADKAGLTLTRLTYTKEQIGFAIGKRLCAIAALTDKGFYRLIVNITP